MIDVDRPTGVECTMADNVAPVVREQAFLESYFQCLSKFAYDKAKEITVGQLHSSKIKALLQKITLIVLDHRNNYKYLSE